MRKLTILTASALVIGLVGFIALGSAMLAIPSADACHKGGDDTKGCDPGPSPPPADANIVATNFKFEPKDFASPDTEIVWRNDGGKHNVRIFDQNGNVIFDQDFKEGSTIQANLTGYSGMLSYVCRFHVNKGMEGTVTLP